MKLRDGPQAKKTVVIFDEAGCIPMYEFLGLSRLGRLIVCLVCVGDKNQLPPYHPGSSRNVFRRVAGGRNQQFIPTMPAETVKSFVRCESTHSDWKDQTYHSVSCSKRHCQSTGRSNLQRRLRDPAQL
jgi:hypothetical protein